jgi:hypothetical protein
MIKHPLINAGAAALYISAGVSLAFYIGPRMGMFDHTAAGPILMLSLLVFSVAVMGYLFFYTPVVLLLDGKREEAMRYFLKTLAFFGVFIVIVVSAILYIASFYPDYIEPQVQTPSTN